MKPRSRVDRARRKDAGFGYTLLTPQLIGFSIFAIYPLFEVFRLSLYRIDALTGSEKFVGLDNFARMTTDQDMPTVLLNTGYLVVLLSVSGTILALSLALLVNQKLRGINIFRAIIFIPTLITMVAWTIVWSFVLQPQGLFDFLLSLLGASPLPWLREHWLAMTMLVVIQLLKNVGLNMMILLAALQAVPAELIDASKVDGANAWRTFRSVVVPEVSPSILMVFMLMIVGSFKVFDQIYLLTQGGPGAATTVLAYYVYHQAFELNDIGYSSALSVLLFVSVLGLTAIIWQLRRRFVAYESE